MTKARELRLLQLKNPLKQQYQPQTQLDIFLANTEYIINAIVF
jgi:hypothetical protein